jgi:hypothetical protein
MLFEPVATPGFKRPLEKLKSQVRESEELIGRLQSSVLYLQNINALGMQALEGFEVPHVLKNTSEWALDLICNVPESPEAAIKEYSLPPDELEKLIEKKRLGREIGIEVSKLSTDWMIVRGALAAANLSAVTTCLQIAVVWAFLEKMTSNLTQGTTTVFSPNDVGIDPSELAEDGFDAVLRRTKAEETIPGLPLVSPAFHLLKAFLDFMRRDAKYQHVLNEQWESSKANVFLVAYFNWWTEGGANVLNQIASDGEVAAERHKQELGELTSKCAALATRLGELGPKAGRYQELKTALPSLS